MTGRGNRIKGAGNVKGLRSLPPLITAAGPNEAIDYRFVEIVNRDTKDGLKALSQTDDTTIVLEASEFEQRAHSDFLSKTARFFLSEPYDTRSGKRAANGSLQVSKP